MGVSTYEFELTSGIAPARFFKALVLDSDNVFPKVHPQSYKKIDIVSGDGGPGTVKKAHLGHGGIQVNRIDVLDTHNLEFSYSVIEGEVLGGVLDKITYRVKIVEGAHGGSVLKATATYFAKGDLEINRDQALQGKEKYSALFKAVEAHLLEHPHLYN
ncbi:hypothetical protein FNV43_RR21154 [Rhamnella rubrinervis]|uniref:Bet v I/Major latex protein domain-containing protein n=1 Tax=Rhamnella rubrinervis TaxID=2594499 RepID=A0A8K0DVR0_9ROSA|nr:hypothetical protein FNV43_RR21154 [Rhamnella rubrinervis]